MQGTCLEGGVEAQVSPLGLARVARRPHDDPLDVAQTPLRVAVVRVCKGKERKKGKIFVPQDD